MAQSSDSEENVLPEVVVTAHKSAVSQLKNRRISDVTTNIQSNTGTAADILNEIPSVEVDADGAVSLRGDTNVTILVDGKPSALFSGSSAGDGLQQLSAAEIDRVEVMTNPPPEFKANGGAGIINIITKKSRRPGTAGSARVSIGNEHRYQMATNGSYNNGPINFSGGVGLRQDYRQRPINDIRSTAELASGLNILSQSSINQDVRRLMPSIKGAAGYRLNEHQSVDFSASLRERHGTKNFSQLEQSQLVDGTTLTQTSRSGAGIERRADSEQKLQFTQDFSRPDESLSLAARHSRMHHEEAFNYFNTYNLPVAASNSDNLSFNTVNDITELSADYVLPLSRIIQIKMGYDFERANNRLANGGGRIDPLSGQIIPNPSIINQFNYVQTIHSLYSSYESSHLLWNFLAGLRLERTYNTLNNQYSGAYPNLRVERRISSEATISLSVNRRVTRPDPQVLDPFIDQRDIQNLRVGNPTLLPEDTRALELGYARESKRFNLELTGYVHHNQNSVTDLSQPLSGTVVLITQANLPSDKSEGLELIASAHPVHQWSYGLSANFFYRQLDLPALGTPGLKSTTGVNAKANLDYRPNGVDTLQLSINHSAKRLTPQGYIDAINLVNIGYRRTLSDQWTAAFTVVDLFNGQVLRRYVVTPELTDTYSRAQVGRVAYIGVTYSFGVPKRSSQDRNSDDAE